MALVNYHNHTTLCGHATGTMNEYVDAAIDKGIIEFGFADHAPLPFHLRKGITMEPNETEYYVSEIEKRKHSYKNKIQIKTGFEVDYPFHDTFNKKYLSDPRIDFLIGSCHFLEEWAFDYIGNIEEFKKRDINSIYLEYFGILDRLIDEKCFNILGHFDLVKKFGHRPSENMQKIITGLSKKIANHDLTVEINTSGLLKPVKEIYPDEKTIKIFFENNVPITLGSDSHSPEEVGYMFHETAEMLKKIGYTKNFRIYKTKKT